MIKSSGTSHEDATGSAGRLRRREAEDAPSAERYDPNCRRCPRLAEYLSECRKRHPGYWCRPVDSFGDASPRVALIGLAPGLHGANRTGRPFTGDFAGILLYRTLFDFGLATKAASVSADDALRLKGVRILNAVKCVPPQNKPRPEEIHRCNRFLKAELEHLRPRLKVLVALGRIGHDAALEALGEKRSSFSFAHGAEHDVGGGRTLIDSYHCSRYNTQTRRLTEKMFRAVIARARVLAGLP